MSTLRPNRTSFFFLAVAFSVFMAFPVEQITHKGYPPGDYWPDSCSDAMIGLNLGNIAQAILAPLFVFLLPGPGSVFQRRTRPSRRLSQIPGCEGDAARNRIRRSFFGVGRSSLAIAVVLLIVGVFLSLRSGWALKTIHYFPDSSATAITLLRLAALCEAIFEVVIGLAAIGAALTIFRERISSQAIYFVPAGWLAAATVAVTWWHALGAYPGVRQGCPALYDWSLPVHSRQPDNVSDFFHYFVYLSLFGGFWAGISAGALRLQAARAGSADSSSMGPLDYSAFAWACFLGWALQYRLSQWFTALAYRTSQEWPFWSATNFLFVIASSLWVLAFVRRLWTKQARNWRLAVWQPFWISFVIYLLTVLTFLWLVLYAVMPLVPPIMTLNAFGLAWALLIGTWRWRMPRKEAAHVTAAG